MFRSVALAIRTSVGMAFAVAVTAALFASALPGGIWLATGRDSTIESHRMGVVALITLLATVPFVVALALWGQYLVQVVKNGRRIAARVVSVQRGRDKVTIRLEVENGRMQEIVTFGRVPVQEGQAVTLCVPVGRSWPVLVQELFADA